jgi:hypothetical protein
MRVGSSKLLCLATLALALSGAHAAFAQRADSASFIVRLGKDTTSIERYIRTADQLIVEAASRSPSTTLHRIVFDLNSQNTVRRASYTIRAPGREQPVLQRSITFTGDSATVVNEQGGQTRTERVAARDVVPMAGPFYTPYELAIMRAVSAGGTKASVNLLANTNLVEIPVERVGRDSVALNNQFGEPMRAHIDARGRLLHLHTPAFTTVERTRWLDLDALAKEFAARDAVGKGLGMLSPRQTYRSKIAEANVWIDYSRPAMRGRPVWGALVPYGRVWRMGANDAAHLSTDRTLQIGDVSVPPGTYTLFLLPAASDWTLIINKQTGMSGLDHDAAHDVGRVRLNLQTVNTPVESFTISLTETPNSNGGAISVMWDRTRGSIPFTVR